MYIKLLTIPCEGGHCAGQDRGWAQGDNIHAGYCCCRIPHSLKACQKAQELRVCKGQGRTQGQVGLECTLALAAQASCARGHWMHRAWEDLRLGAPADFLFEFGIKLAIDFNPPGSVLSRPIACIRGVCCCDNLEPGCLCLVVWKHHCSVEFVEMLGPAQLQDH